MPYQSVNPSNGELLRTFDEHTDQQMEKMLVTAERTFREVWSRKPIRDRAKVVGKAASLMLEQKEKFAYLATLEMGKRIAESRGEVELSASILKYYADNAETFLAPRALSSVAGDAYIEYSPMGVLIGVQPWNYPYYQLARFAAPHLMAGNVMLVKHAPGVPQCAIAFQQLFSEAGAPSGAYTNVFLSNDQVAKLIDDPRTRGVALTGSERAGESLASRAGKNLKKSTMELGGSDPFIVLEDYDLEDAVKMAVVGRIGNAGQTCIGAKRFIFVGPRLNQFVAMFRAALESLNIGDPFDEETTLGPLSSEAALTHLLEQVNEAVAHGAKVVTGGKRVDRKGVFMQPTILTDITQGNPASPGVLWSRCTYLSRQRRGGSDCHRQRFSIRFGRLHLHQEHRAWKARRQQNRNRHGLHQLPLGEHGGFAFRRNKTVWLWQGTFRSRNSGIRKQETDLRVQWVLPGRVG